MLAELVLDAPVDVVKSDLPEQPHRFLPLAGQQRVGLGLLHAHAVVLHDQQEAIFFPAGGQFDGSRAALGFNTVEDGVLQQRLKGESGQQRRAQLRRDVLRQVDRPAVPVVLDDEIVSQQGQFFRRGINVCCPLEALLSR